MSLSSLITNFFIPPNCICCGVTLDVRVKYCICNECAEKLPFANGRKCKICGMPLSSQYGDLYCQNCKNNKRSFAQNVSRYIYKDGISVAIKKMKFGSKQLWIADTFGIFLSQTVQEEYGDISFDGVTYVPVSKKRYFERSFNQSEEIAEALCQRLRLPFLRDVLIKPFDTPKQSSLKFNERANNVRGKFAIAKPEFVVDKTILLIDDVFTSGETINECAKILKKAGATSVYTATVAIVKLD